MSQDFGVPGGPNDPDGPQVVIADIYLFDGNQIDGSACIGLSLGIENDPVAPAHQGDGVFSQKFMTPNVGHLQF